MGAPRVTAFDSSFHTGPTVHRIDLDEALQPRAALAERSTRRIGHPLYERSHRVGYLVDELLAPGSVFHGKVHAVSGSAFSSLADSSAGTPPVTLATFTGAIRTMLYEAPHVEAVCLPEALVAEANAHGPRSVSHQKVEQGGRLLAGLFANYWRAVATAFSDAWDDPREHLLWHPHGLTALARLGAHVVHDQVAKYDIRQHYFDAVLDHIAGGVSLARSRFADPDGRDTAEHLFTLMAAARTATGVRPSRTIAMPGAVAEIEWGSAEAPRSPTLPVRPFGAED